MPYPHFLPASSALLSDFGSKVMIYLNLRRAPFSAVLKKREKFTCFLTSISLSLSLLLRHRVIVATAESGGLRPPGLASGRPPGSARGRPQGQVTTLGLLCLLPVPPSNCIMIPVEMRDNSAAATIMLNGISKLGK